MIITVQITLFSIFFCSEQTVHIWQAEDEKEIHKLEAVIMHLEGAKCSHLSAMACTAKSPKRNSKTNENKRLKRYQKRSKMRVNIAGGS